MEKPIKTELIKVIERAEGTKSFRFNRPKEYSYQPGQFFFINIPGKEGMLRKHFSFSSAPNENFLEFTTRMTGSEYKNVLDALKRGTMVELGAPLGNFTLRPGVNKIVFLSGGIGVTPILSICKHATNKQLPVNMVIFYGNRNVSATAFMKELDELTQANKRLKVVHTMSDPGDDWTGRTGRINDDLIKEEAPDWHERTFYISGPPGMVAAMKGLTEKMALSSEQLITENFTGY